MTDVDSHLTEARRRFASGDPKGARESCERAAEADPECAEAAHMLGVLASQDGDIGAAVGHFEHAVELDPGDAAGFNNLGTAYRALDRLDEAERNYRRALGLNPASAPASFNLGNLLMNRGAIEDAVQAYRQAIAADPDHGGARNNLTLALRVSGRLGEAAKEATALVERDPESADGHSNLGVIRMEQGLTGEAVGYYRRALELAPDSLEASNNLGVALLDLGQAEASVEVLQGALELDDQVPEIHDNLGNALRKLGDVGAAADAFGRALRIRPSDGVRVRLATLLPVIPGSVAEIDDARRRFSTALDELIADPPRLDDPNREVGATAFDLSYHDADNRDLLRKLAGMYEVACPSLLYTAPHCGDKRRHPGRRLKVGIVSRYFRTHAVGWCFEQLIQRLPRERIELALLTFPQNPDPIFDRIAAAADAVVVLPIDLAAAREKIAGLELDILIYTDIGMDPLTYFLAFSRLAPVQCKLNGHPETSGIAAIDFNISSLEAETEAGDDHYTETLIRLPGRPFCYARPELPKAVKSRADFGLPEDRRIYFCAQTLIKVHPDMDALFGGILGADPEGELVLLSGFNPRLVDRLQDRFAGSLGATADRVRFLPTLSHADFMNVLMIADVSLDTRPFGGGNTGWQAISAGTPVVNWPSDHVRGRYQQAMYKAVGVDDCTVTRDEDYVEAAVQLATSSAYRDDVAARVEAGTEGLFLDEQVVEAFEQFLAEGAWED